MAKNAYIGVSSKARKVKRIYIGVDGKARKVKKAYIGVNGVARLCYLSFRSTITVTYPAGYTCKCVLGSTTLTSDTSGSYTFTVEEAGSWVVSCVVGSYTHTATVSITATGQAKTADLRYLYLYNGSYGVAATNECKGITGGWLGTGAKINNGYASDAPTITRSASNIKVTPVSGSYETGVMYTKSKVDLTNYTKLYIKGSTNNIESDGVYWLVTLTGVSGTDLTNYLVSYKSVKSTTINTYLDVSSLSGSYHVAVRVCSGRETTTYSLTMTHCYLGV